MKTKIKFLSKNEKRTLIIFNLDGSILKNIEKSFKKINPKFKLSDYEKHYAGKLVKDSWEFSRENERFNFSLMKKRDIVKLKIKSKLRIIEKFLKELYKHTEFAELSPLAKRKFEKHKKEKILFEKYSKFFEKLLNEKDAEKQQKIAEDIANFSGKISDEVEENYYNKTIQKIQNSCLSMEHWKDETGYCDLTKKDIKGFLTKLKNEMSIL